MSQIFYFYNNIPGSAQKKHHVVKPKVRFVFHLLCVKILLFFNNVVTTFKSKKALKNMKLRKMHFSKKNSKVKPS